MNYIFGYGSLITPIGINGRNMSRVYTKQDLTPAILHGCRREWNAVYNGQKYLGLVIGVEPQFFNSANGVLFSICDADLLPFKESEGINDVPPMYEFKDVTDFVITSLVKPDDRIFTCVTVKPTYKGIIPPHYLLILQDGFNLWGPRFKQLFMNTTFKGEEIKWDTHN
jgi:hypothetical protein